MYSAPMPFGAPILWPLIARKVDAERPRVHRDLSDRLHGVRVEYRAAGLRERCEFVDRLDGADLVVHPHHGADGGVVAHVFVRGLHRHGSGFIDGEQALLRALD